MARYRHPGSSQQSERRGSLREAMGEEYWKDWVTNAPFDEHMNRITPGTRTVKDLKDLGKYREEFD